jgi:hypothetical protein
VTEDSCRICEERVTSGETMNASTSGPRMDMTAGTKAVEPKGRSTPRFFIQRSTEEQAASGFDKRSRMPTW